MGVKLNALIHPQPISLERLQGKTLVFDAFNMLYQFITTIRSPDGGLFTDKHGNVTSHIIGLLSRTSYFIKHKINPVFVFDGQKPALKLAELERRKTIKTEANALYESAQKKGDVEGMKKYAARTSRLTTNMIEDALTLLNFLGISVVHAPAEGEAQAAYMVSQGDGWAVVSQDYDSLLHKASRLITNLNIAGRKKKGRTSTVVTPSMIVLKETLQRLELTQKQLIQLAMLVGTDYAKGVKGIGPKKALHLVKKYQDEELFSKTDWKKHNRVSWREVYTLFTTMPVNHDYEVTHGKINKDKLFDFLVNQRGFSEARVHAAIQTLPDTTQKKLGEW